MAGILGVGLWEARAWDSAFFGASIAQVTAPRMTGADLARAVEEARLAGVECLYFLADAGDEGSVAAAEALRFSLVDVRLSLERPLRPADHGLPPCGAVRAARPDDVPQLMALARVNHRNTRFHRDRRFDPARSDELYAVWLERSVGGELADAVRVLEIDDAPRGYITLCRDGGQSRIGLVAVDAPYRGLGYGDHLLSEAIRWSAGEGFPRLSVVTQGSSAAAIRFYERAGFATSGVAFWYHRWLTAEESPARGHALER